MSKRYGQVWSALGAAMVMALGAAASAASPVALAAAAPLASVVPPQPEAGRPAPSRAKLQVAASGASGPPSQWSASQPLPVAGHKARNYALLLSSLGMLGMIAWQRLSRTF